MADHYIIATSRDPHTNAVTHVWSSAFWWTVELAVQWHDQGHRFYIGTGLSRVAVVPVSGALGSYRYLRSDPNTTVQDNLLNLPTKPKPS